MQAFVCEQCDESASREDIGSYLSNGPDTWLEVMLPNEAPKGRVFSEGPYHFCSVAHLESWLEAMVEEASEGADVAAEQMGVNLDN